MRQTSSVLIERVVGCTYGNFVRHFFFSEHCSDDTLNLIPQSRGGKSSKTQEKVYMFGLAFSVEVD